MKKRLIADNKLELHNTQGQTINSYGLPKPSDAISMEFDQWIMLPEVKEQLDKGIITEEKAREIWHDGNQKAYEWAKKYNNFYLNTHANTFNNTLNLDPEDPNNKKLLEEYERQKQKAFELQMQRLLNLNLYNKDIKVDKRQKWFEPKDLVQVLRQNDGKGKDVHFNDTLDVDTRDKPFIWIENFHFPTPEEDCIDTSKGTIVIGMPNDSHMTTISRRVLKDDFAYEPPQQEDEKYHKDGKYDAELFMKDLDEFRNKNLWFRNHIQDHKDLERRMIFGHIYEDIAVLDGTSWQGEDANMDNAVSALKSCGEFSQVWKIVHNSMFGQTVKQAKKLLKLKNCYAKLVYCAPQSLGLNHTMQNAIRKLAHSEELATFIYKDFLNNSTAMQEMATLLQENCEISATNLADIITETVNDQYVLQARNTSDEAGAGKKNVGNHSYRLLRAIDKIQTLVINHCMDIIREKSSDFDKHLNDVIDNYFTDKTNLENIYNRLAENNSTLKAILNSKSITEKGKEAVKTFFTRNISMTKAQNGFLRHEIIKNANINNFEAQWAKLINVNINNSEEIQEAIKNKIETTPNWKEENDIELVKFIQKGLYKLFLYGNNDYRKFLFRRFKVPSINPDTGDFNFM